MFSLFLENEEVNNFKSKLLVAIITIWSVVTGVIVSAGFYFFPELWLRWLLFLSISVVIAIVNIFINSLGHTKLASWSFTLMLWLYITVPCFSAGGIMAPGVLMQTSVILTAAFILGWQSGLLIGIITIIADLLLVYLQITGSLPEPSVIHNPISRWISAIIPFGTILALQYFATKHMRKGLASMVREIERRKHAEELKDKTLNDLKERVKELQTLYTVSKILQNEIANSDDQFQRITDTIPNGFQYPEITAASFCVGNKNYLTANYLKTEPSLKVEMFTAKGTKVCVEVVYLQAMPEMDEGPFLKEERLLLDMLVEMVKIDLDRKERGKELKDYKYALDTASLVSISDNMGYFTYTNQNFIDVSQYTKDEILGQHHSLIWSGLHSAEYFDDLRDAMQKGEPFKGEFCNKMKDGTLYWVDTTVVPFLDEYNNVYQYLSINFDVTERKLAQEKVKKNEELLRKITGQVPGNTYMFEIEESGRSTVIFMNRGTDIYNHKYEMNEIVQKPELLREMLHEDDKEKFNEAMKFAYANNSVISLQYRMIVNDQVRWRWMQAVPEKNEVGKTIWYGATADITPLVDYLTSIEQVVFDINHVIRRPISSMLGMTSLIANNDLSAEEIKEIANKLHHIAEEMDTFIKQLTVAYDSKRNEMNFTFDIDSVSDKRYSFFK